jgi:hypothetical protein
MIFLKYHRHVKTAAVFILAAEVCLLASPLVRLEADACRPACHHAGRSDSGMDKAVR